jgi:hypothetical protein
MGPLEGPHKKEKVKQYLTRHLRAHEVGPYLLARRAGKSALMGTLEGPIWGLNREPKGLPKGPICTTRGPQWGPNRGHWGSLLRPLGGPDETSRGPLGGPQ